MSILKVRQNTQQWHLELTPMQLLLGLQLAGADGNVSQFYSRIAAMPGRSMPSRYSSIAPPPVET